MDKILSSNPILEAFGNAKTIRNDNSSRFGKFIELNFNKRGVLIGGTIKTYLLEKIRLISQQNGERNFHIFYQIANGITEEQMGEMELQSLSAYWYTQQGNTFILNNMDDKQEFESLLKAFRILKFSEAEIQVLINSMIGILNFGQIKFQDVYINNVESSKLVETKEKYGTF